MLTTPEEEDEEEHYEDVQEEYEEVNEEGQQEEIDRPCSLQNYYDGRQRDPRFAKAETSCLWELASIITYMSHVWARVANNTGLTYRYLSEITTILRFQNMQISCSEEKRSMNNRKCIFTHWSTSWIALFTAIPRRQQGPVASRLCSHLHCGKMVVSCLLAVLYSKRLSIQRSSGARRSTKYL